MTKVKKVIKKPFVKRALRTFLQTAIGYILTNATLAFGGMDFSNGDVLKNTLIGFAVSAVSAGASAVMNLKEGEDKTGE